MDWSAYKVALFDLDGVLTPTAELHQQAWAALFTDYLSDHPDAAAYEPTDYFDHLDGKSRVDGVRALLSSRGLELPTGEASDAASVETVHGLGNRKNEVFNELLAADGIAPYPGTVELLDALDDLGIGLAVVSSSRNARTVLQGAGLLDRFAVVVDGDVIKREGLSGKPAPDPYLLAAALLGAEPAASVVIEDATSGAAAGKAAGCFVVGVDRGTGADALRASGADLVITELTELLP